MSRGTKIEWATATFNWVEGCTRAAVGNEADEGCAHCYAINFIGRGLRPGHSELVRLLKTPDARRDGERRDWSGEVAVHEGRFAQLDRWRSPERIFVNSLGDTFHAKVPTAALHRMLDRMAAVERHVYLLLTKRAKRARNVCFEWLSARGRTALPANIWPMVSASTERALIERAPPLLQIPARVRGLSLEPCLGPMPSLPSFLTGRASIGWVIFGGESGAKARPMNAEWPGIVRDACLAAEVPFFFKQWGQWSPKRPDDAACPPRRRIVLSDGTAVDPNDLRAEHFEALADGSATVMVRRRSVADAGHLLDGVEWQQLPPAWAAHVAAQAKAQTDSVATGGAR
ncbi:MAG: DUF5131 family protein [Myxococcales bacterium]|nr:DUF5131 family protein [Myxococcales bacterium]